MASNNPTESKTKKRKKPKKKPTAVPQKDDEAQTANSVKDDGQTAGETPDIPSEDSDAEPHDDDAPGTDTKSSEHSPVENEVVNGTADSTADKDPTTRFDELVKERDALRLEVTQVRQSLEQLQVDHDNELENLKTQLEESQGEKDYAEEQYQNLLGKVNTIRSQLAERMKNDAEDLAQARVQIDELEEQKNGLQEQCTARSAEVDDLRTQIQEQSKDLSSLRNRSTLSQQNWIKEKEELLESEAYMREEYDNAKQAMHDWEVLAMEERTIRKDLSERVKDLEESLENIRDGYQKATEERNTQSSTVDGLQKALQELQNVRKSELKEIVESSQAEITGLRENIQELEKALEVSRSDAEATKTELERTLPFEKEVKEKNLLIGKLRHETVILSDHLTKALRFLRKGKPEDNVDRQIVTTYFLQFLALDRSDAKKFQILQLIAALLGWTDEQKEQAGLSRPGSNFGSLGSGRGLTIHSPIHRTPSTPALSHEYFADPGSAISPGSKETLGELWQNFLEQEATSKDVKSRTASATTPQP